MQYIAIQHSLIEYESLNEPAGSDSRQVGIEMSTPLALHCQNRCTAMVTMVCAKQSHSRRSCAAATNRHLWSRPHLIERMRVDFVNM